MNKAIFLDRDGTIIKDKIYLYKLEDVEFVRNLDKALRNFIKHKYRLIIITNQSGIGRGIFEEKDMHIVNQYIKQELIKKNILIDSFYYCPHYIGSKIPEYNIKCSCRKPLPGMIFQAAKDYSIDLDESYMIGDREIDRLAGINAELKAAYHLDDHHDLLYYSQLICSQD